MSPSMCVYLYIHLVYAICIDTRVIECAICIQFTVYETRSTKICAHTCGEQQWVRTTIHRYVYVTCCMFKFYRCYCKYFYAIYVQFIFFVVVFWTKNIYFIVGAAFLLTLSTSQNIFRYFRLVNVCCSSALFLFSSHSSAAVDWYARLNVYA